MARTPEKYKEIMAKAQQTATSLSVCEKNELGVTRHEVAGYLLGLWGLPHPVIEAVVFHDAPALVPHESFELVDALHVAVALIAKSVPSNQQIPCSPLDEVHIKMLGQSDQIPKWAEEVKTLMARSK